MHGPLRHEHDVLTRKLKPYVRLSDSERHALGAAFNWRVRRTGSRRDIIREGDRPSHLTVVLEGWACRHKVLKDGRRQIIAFLLPGDMCDLHIDALREMDHSIGALTPLTYAQMSRDAYEELARGHPKIVYALWWSRLVADAVQRQWTMNIGQRSAVERVAHLLCELFYRLDAVGLTTNASFEMPFSQNELADAQGMTPVHANRVLRELRKLELVRLEARRLTILDFEGLQRLAMFNSSYLHLQPENEPKSPKRRLLSV